MSKIITVMAGDMVVTGTVDQLRKMSVEIGGTIATLIMLGADKGPSYEIVSKLQSAIEDKLASLDTEDEVA
jgi:2-keto-4-pentenoate hydratase/2-oxohepta-3-ene-1,7-dioic acid hydratase in catechol pathway